MSPLRWLHISDLHFYDQQKPSGLRFEQKIVTQQLLRDVVEMRRRFDDPPDFVLLTGDIAFGGEQAEYKAAQEWVNNLEAAAGLGKKSIFIVPGNHDVQRRSATSPRSRQTIHEQLRAKPDTLDEYLANEDDAKALLAKQTKFFEFAQQYGGSGRKDGEPFWREQLSSSVGTLSVLGLNSALLSYDNGDAPRNQALGAAQLQALLPGTDNGLLVVLMHHPPDWLRDGQRLLALLGQRPHLLFTGHEHEQAGTMHTRLLGSSVIHFAAGAGFGDQEGEHAYSWGSLSSDGLCYYPRLWHRRTMSFVDDPASSEFVQRSNDGSHHFVLREKLPRPLQQWLPQWRPPLSSQSVPAATSMPQHLPAPDTAPKPKMSAPSDRQAAWSGFTSITSQQSMAWPLGRWLRWARMPGNGFHGFRSIAQSDSSLDTAALSQTWNMRTAKQKGPQE